MVKPHLKTILTNNICMFYVTLQHPRTCKTYSGRLRSDICPQRDG